MLLIEIEIGKLVCNSFIFHGSKDLVGVVS